MSEVALYNFNGTDIRVVMQDDEPWFVASDICAVLGIVDTRQAVSRINVDDRCLAPVIDSLGREQPTSVVNEPGLYELVFRSAKPEAVTFRRWVTSEVLPTIRKTGSYSVAVMTPAETLLAQAQLAVDQERRLTDHDRRLTAIEARQSADAGEHNWFTALGFAKLHGMPTDRPSLSMYGKRASALMRARGNQPHQRQDATFGMINVYPVDILLEAFDLESEDG